MTTVELVLTRPDAVLLPGAVFHGSLTVRNTGREVQRYALLVAGSLAAWTMLESAELRLWPGDRAAVAVRVAVPCAPSPAAGAHTIGVRVTDVDGAPASVEQPVEVAPCPRPLLSPPHPPVLWTARHALVHVDIGNEGNVHLPVRLMVTQREGRVVWREHPDGEVFQLPPGQRFRRPVRLTLRRPSLLGKDAPREYRVVLLSPPPSGPAPVQTSEPAMITQTPVLRRWWLAVLSALVAVAVAADLGPGLVVVLVLALAIMAAVRFGRVVTAGRGS